MTVMKLGSTPRPAAWSPLSSFPPPEEFLSAPIHSPPLVAWLVLHSFSPLFMYTTYWTREINFLLFNAHVIFAYKQWHGSLGHYKYFFYNHFSCNCFSTAHSSRQLSKSHSSTKHTLKIQAQSTSISPLRRRGLVGAPWMCWRYEGPHSFLPPPVKKSI
jgi:hypothetical protein